VVILMMEVEELVIHLLQIHLKVILEEMMLDQDVDHLLELEVVVELLLLEIMQVLEKVEMEVQEHQTILQEQQQHMLEVVAVPFIFQELLVVVELVVEDVVLFIKVAHLNQIQIQQEMQTLVVEQVEVP
tara:strand:- start:875 stop:1261 length:387 start_codon:yes stop_codon:yes gene_type:complete